VYHAWSVVSVSRWPMRVWRVTDVGAAPPESQLSPSYTRANSVRIVDEVEAWRVFGASGWAVATVIEGSASIDRDDVTVLAPGRSADSDDLYARAWEAWDPGTAGGSPVGSGLILVWQAVEQAARSIDPSLFTFDPVDGVDVLTDRDWTLAGRACTEAALAFGAPSLLSASDGELLSATWRAHFDNPRRPILT
jgi:hypothetical protein